MRFTPSNLLSLLAVGALFQPVVVPRAITTGLINRSDDSSLTKCDVTLGCVGHETIKATDLEYHTGIPALLEKRGRAPNRNGPNKPGRPATTNKPNTGPTTTPKSSTTTKSPAVSTTKPTKTSSTTLTAKPTTSSKVHSTTSSKAVSSTRASSSATSSRSTSKPTSTAKPTTLSTTTLSSKSSTQSSSSSSSQSTTSSRESSATTSEEQFTTRSETPSTTDSARTTEPTSKVESTTSSDEHTATKTSSTAVPTSSEKETTTSSESTTKESSYTPVPTSLETESTSSSDEHTTTETSSTAVPTSSEKESITSSSTTKESSYTTVPTSSETESTSSSDEYSTTESASTPVSTSDAKPTTSSDNHSTTKSASTPVPTETESRTSSEADSTTDSAQEPTPTSEPGLSHGRGNEKNTSILTWEEYMEDGAKVINRLKDALKNKKPDVSAVDIEPRYKVEHAHQVIGKVVKNKPNVKWDFWKATRLDQSAEYDRTVVKIHPADNNDQQKPQQDSNDPNKDVISDNYYNKAQKTMVVAWSDVNIDNTQPEDTQLRWSDVTFEGWKEHAGDDAKNLRWIVRNNIINQGTIATIREALRRTGRNTDKRAEFAPDPNDNTMNEAFTALAGTPNVKGVFHMLADHHNELGGLTIKKIYAFGANMLLLGLGR
ncbi:hypothetical protein MGYG_05317 [Nannizzia gypsea CBS 118893]|uniref:Uncharacterized protein n=1 Tax=Arthroderma gypseum (strain ATCC MYA-4604 / CBS 118893) TaxID=535722 RepID=E4UVJ3_ARTGP|nr:hypothetical protein MGYG_05317 [Nannizzia gypsea CBS 118893]EFR02320.1 hypothetical protein MGYG_05317 [Nannizzia gypsea CBS 118893]